MSFGYACRDVVTSAMDRRQAVDDLADACRDWRNSVEARAVSGRIAFECSAASGALALSRLMTWAACEGWAQASGHRGGYLDAMRRLTFTEAIARGEFRLAWPD